MIPGYHWPETTAAERSLDTFALDLPSFSVESWPATQNTAEEVGSQCSDSMLCPRIPFSSREAGTAIPANAAEPWQTSPSCDCPFGCQTRLAHQFAQLDRYVQSGRTSRIETLTLLANDADHQRRSTTHCVVCNSENRRPGTFTIMVGILDRLLSLVERRMQSADLPAFELEVPRRPAVSRCILAENQGNIIACAQALQTMLKEHLHATLSLEHELAGDSRDCIEPCKTALARLRARAKHALAMELFPRT